MLHEGRGGVWRECISSVSQGAPRVAKNHEKLGKGKEGFSHRAERTWPS